MPPWFTSLMYSLGALITLSSGAVTVFVLYRSKNAEVIKGEMEIYKAKAERLDKENRDLQQSNHDKDVEIADLKARTDLSEIRKGQLAIIEQQSKQNAAVLENQINGMKMGKTIQEAMGQMVATLQKMQERLDRGLIMGS